MSIFWNAVSDSITGETTVSIIMSDGSSYDVRSDHPNFASILATLATCVGDYDVVEKSEELLNLVNIATSISDRLTSLSERVSTDGNQIYFDGDPVDSSVATYLIRALRREGLVTGLQDRDVRDDAETSNLTWRGIVAFMEKLYQNPSVESIEHLYTFIRRYSLTIRENGDFIAFKGLRDDYSSIHSGPGIVNDRNFKRAHLDNSPGNVVKIARSYVDTERKNGCSTGLHAGTLEFARKFSMGKIVSVAINPRDVVSVPSDCAFQKLRVSRYEVLTDVPHNFTSEDRDIIWDEYDDDYDCEDCGLDICDCEWDEDTEENETCSHCGTVMDEDYCDYCESIVAY